MLTQIYIELYKFKRSKILWVIIALVVVHALWSFFQASIQSISWDVFLNSQYMNLWIRPAFFTFLSAYLFIRDYEEKSIGTFLTYPFSRSQWYFSKLITSFCIISLIIIVNFGIDLAIGILLIDQPLNFSILGNQLVFLIELILLYSALIPLSAAIGIWLKKYVFCAVVSAFVVGISTIFGASSRYITLNPWLFPYLFSHYPQNLSNIYLWIPGIYVSIVIVALGGLLGYYRYIKTDVIKL
jgi:ABC-type transport system involved in multi-copper enzyme maturation permease subunit